ncbi:precorrin-3B C(17)-methyltransferase [Garciella nitratireducens]|uniref:Cobalt-precorrin 3 C17-methyltransferase n=1 Tax=Garciella nitratireducens DSM 15102 TaxID=1121911 RepID=A0A1T4KIR9_9FIRM|nr:precorrin-3B C(17)-methyltransferase [Garciella nitratireducens]SJZ42277.1 cobalt-precorrin 3 C17-methyltransferase [Garciella nitratireducens DSM 15102]
MKQEGILYVVGIGPGNLEHLTQAAKNALESADIIIGYTTYIFLIKDIIMGKKVIQSPMKGETDRCKKALELAHKGEKVAIVSSGDAGIYGMAGIVYEIAQREEMNLKIEVIPGVTAAFAAAAVLGAPIMHDFAVISLSDLMTDWNLIQKRLELAAKADFVICLYNPKSQKRVKQIQIAREILMQFRTLQTPVGIVKNAQRENQEIFLTNLQEMLNYPIDMFTTIIIGNSHTKILNGKIVTPRGYQF